MYPQVGEGTKGNYGPQGQKKSRCPSCCKTRLCAGIAFLSLLTIGLLIGFLFPRDVYIQGTDPDDRVGTVSLTSGLQIVAEVNTLVMNPNWVSVDVIDFNGDLMYGDIQLGTVELSDDLSPFTLVKRNTSKMPLAILPDVSLLSIPKLLVNAAKDCFGSKGNLTVRVIGDADVKYLGISATRPRDVTTSIPCNFLG